MDGQQVSRLGKYEILEEIGRGGFATVYKDLDPGLQRQVALKVLHPHLAGDRPFVERFLREARAAASLNHPHIVTIYEVGEEQGDYYIAMQYLSGPSLMDIIANEAPVGVERAVELLTPVAQALDYAHGRGFIHRDVKPSNIVLDEEGRPVLTDFGLVRAEEDASTATLSMTGMTLGTPQYMAPEQADPDYEGELDGRCDVYALGVVAYELLTGRPPFRGKTPLKVLMAQVSKPPPRPQEVNPSLPEAVGVVLLKALAKTPEDRYQSGSAFVQALRQAGSESKAERPDNIQVEVVEGEPTVVREWRRVSLPPRLAVLHPMNATQVAEVGRLGLGSIECVAYSPDGRLMAVGTSGEVELRDAQTLQLLHVLHTGVAHSVAFNSNSQILALGSLRDSTVWLWQVADDTPLHTLEGHTDVVNSVVFSPDGALLASGSDDNTVRLWRVSDGAPVRTLAGGGKSNEVQSVAFSPDGVLLAAGSRDATVRLWRVSDGVLFRTLVHTGWVWSVAFSPDGALLISGSPREVRLWRVSDGGLLRTLEGAFVSNVAFSPDGALLASGSEDNTVGLWRVSDGELLRTLEGHRAFVSSVAFSPDGALLISGSEDNTVRLWRVSDGAPLRSLEGEGRTRELYSVAFSPDGVLLASGTAYPCSTVRLWRVSDGALLRSLEGHVGSAVRTVAFSPDGALLASGAGDETVGLWQVSDGALLRTLEEDNEVCSVTFSPDGALLASGTMKGLRDSAVRLWRVSDGALLRTLEGHTDTVHSVAFSPDGAVLASGGGDATMRLWRVWDGVLLRIIEGPTGAMQSVAFSAGGTLLASGSWGEVRLWQVSDGTPLRILEGHTDWVTSLAFSSSGQILASVSLDGTVQLWRVKDGSRLRILAAHTGDAPDVALSPDGKLLALGAGDGTVRLWGVVE